MSLSHEASSAPRIRLLPPHVIDRIAAGEVIERPAAVVKELLENALDAGARSVSISLSGGGIDRIEVVDDGVGMTATELALAVQRHATSKLVDESLVRITTLGFRGEALPSIGAVAKLAITSRPAGAESAYMIRLEGGEIFPVRPAAGTFGTKVVVSDLFFATPARRKFLKPPRTEAEHAEAVIRRLALANPEVAFRLEVDGTVCFHAPAQDLAGRIAALLGEEAAALLPIEARRGALAVTGFLGPATLHRATGAAQFLVVNRRPVVDPLLKTALRVAYRDVIPAGRQPVAAILLTLPPEEVDVNVHPAKTELRFRDPNAVRGFLIGTIQKELAQGAGRAPAAEGFAHLSPWRMPFSRSLHLPAAARRSGLAEAQLRLAPALQASPSPAPPSEKSVSLPEPPELSPEHPLGAPLTQLWETYILAIAPDGALVLVDQHAAHERLTHEALRDAWHAGGVPAQPLLLPAVVELAAADAERLLARKDELSQLGLEIESFGIGAVLVRALPAPLSGADPTPLLRDIAEELAEWGEATALAARLDAVIARMACHGSIRAGRRLSLEEMSALLRTMERSPRAATCSHGRPTYLKFGAADFARMFGRK